MLEKRKVIIGKPMPSNILEALVSGVNQGTKKLELIVKAPTAVKEHPRFLHTTHVFNGQSDIDWNFFLNGHVSMH